MSDLNGRIRQLRGFLGLTQTEFGEKIGLKQNTVALIESGRNTSDQSILAICNAFGVNEKWLREGKGEMMKVDASDELEAVAQRYNLSFEAQVAVERFVKLKQEDQNAIIRYLTQVAEAIASKDETDDLHALLDQVIEAQKKAEESSTSLPFIGESKTHGAG